MLPEDGIGQLLCYLEVEVRHLSSGDSSATGGLEEHETPRTTALRKNHDTAHDRRAVFSLLAGYLSLIGSACEQWARPNQRGKAAQDMANVVVPFPVSYFLTGLENKRLAEALQKPLRVPPSFDSHPTIVARRTYPELERCSDAAPALFLAQLLLVNDSRQWLPIVTNLGLFPATLPQFLAERIGCRVSRRLEVIQHVSQHPAFVVSNRIVTSDGHLWQRPLSVIRSPPACQG